MEKTLGKIKEKLAILKTNRGALMKNLDITKHNLDTYILDCKDWDEPLDLIIVSDLENKISKINKELKKLNSTIFKYELAIERYGG